MTKSLTVLGLVLALFGALVRGESPPEERSVPVAQPIKTAPSHILAPDELIEIKVFQEPDLTTSTRIPNDGRINFPLIGDVAVAGKSVQQATQMIQERLGARFLVNPQVSIAVIEPAKRLFTVLGQVQRPGTYRFPDRQSLDLMQVIGIAGGYTRLADPAKITVKRHVSGKETVFRVDGKRLATDQKSSPFMVADGDLISIGERLF